MSVDSKEIELIIKANNQSKQTLDGVAKSISELNDLIDAQAAAAKKGAVGIDELKATFIQLQQAQDKLKNQADLIARFERTSKATETLTDRALKATKAYDEYNAKVTASGVITDAQAVRLQKLALASERATKAVAGNADVVARLKQDLAGASIDVNNLADAEDKARRSAAELGLGIGRLNGVIENYTVDLRAAKVAQAQLADDQAFTRQAAEAAKLAKSADYVLFWANALDKADDAQRKTAVVQLLQDQADKAIAAANGYETLANSINDTPRPMRDLANQLRAISDPAAQARTTLDGLSQQIREAARVIKEIDGPVEDYKDKLQQLQAAQKALSTQGAGVDAYRTQAAALKAARAEFVDARAEVQRYADAIRNSTEPSEQLNNALRTAQGRLQLAANSVRENAAATREMQATLRQAGIDTNNLAGAEARIISLTKTNTQSVKTLTAAYREHGVAVANAEAKHSFFTSSGRTTLSLLQRIRGEILAVTAGYIGLQGAVTTARSAIEIMSTREGVKNQLALSVGNDRAAIDAEYEYVKGQADRMGLEFDRAAKSYAKFSAAARLAGRDQKEIRYIWESFSEVGRVANLTADDLDGVYKALEQMVSKGSIQAEELRGQLGDRLFGAFQVAAESLKDQFPELDKAMKNGLVTSDQLIKIAERYKEIVAAQLPAALTNAVAEQNRFNTAVADFKEEVAKAGFGEAYIEFLRETRELLQSEDGKRFAQSLSGIFTFLLKSLQFVLEHLDEIKLVLAITFGAKGAAMLMSFIAAWPKLLGNMKAFTAATYGAAGAVGTLSSTVLLLFAAFAGWQLGSWAYEQFGEVRAAGAAMVIGFMTMWAHMKGGAQVAWEVIKGYFIEGGASILNSMTTSIRGMLMLFEQMARKLGKTELADQIAQGIDFITLKTEGWGNRMARIRGIAADMRKELDQIRAVGDDMFADALNPAKAGKAAATEATGKPDAAPGSTKAVTDEAGLEKRKNLIQSILNALAELDAKINRRDTDVLENRLKQFDAQATALRAKLRELGGPEAAEFEKQLDAKLNTLKLQETKKFNDELLAEQDALLKKIETAEVKSGKKQTDELKVRLDAIDTEYRQMYDDIAAAQDKLKANGRDTSELDLMKQRLDAAVNELKVIAQKDILMDQMHEREKEVAHLLAERNRRIEEINNLEEAGSLTAAQADERRQAEFDRMAPKIKEAAETAKQFAASMIAAIDPAKADAFIAAMDAIIAKSNKANKDLYTFQQSQKDISAGLAQSMRAGLEGLVAFIGGVGDLGDAFDAVGKTFLQFAADFLMKIAEMIIQQTILNMLGGFGFSIGGTGKVTLGQAHTGGVVGSSGGLVQRSAQASWFAGAPRYHSGGIAGLAADEYPTILQKNEEVLKADDPRNILNGGASSAGGGTSSRPQDIKIINTIDPLSVLKEALATQAGVKVLQNIVYANRTGFKQAFNN